LKLASGFSAFCAALELPRGELVDDHSGGPVMSCGRGPWRTGPINYADVYDADGNLVALVPKGHPHTIDNALLIASSPTLLEACLFVKRFFAKLEDIDEDDPLKKLREHFHAPVHAVLDFAIAKAQRAGTPGQHETPETPEQEPI
jgi:hypothetical protein